jgi:hypothetical protein
MRIIRFDDGTRFDSPNVYWGNPAYELQPGDPGYIDPNPSPTKPKPRIMSSNATPENRIILTALAKSILAGQLAHQVTVGLHHHTAAEMDPAIKKLAGDPGAAEGSPAKKGSQLLYRDCLDATGDARDDLRDLSDGDVKTWLDGYRKVLEGLHGRRSNAAWQAAGFGPGTTAVPRGHEARLVLLGAARAYLGAYPAYETTLPRVDLPPLAITAAAAEALETQLQTARTLIGTRESEEATCKAVRDADVEALYDEVSATITELDDRLPADDPRWELFGLNIPAHPTPPLGVTGLTSTAAGTGRELLAWPYAVRADYYRVYLKRSGVDEDFVNIADPKDLEYTLKDLPPDTEISVYVVPMNEAGAGPASPTVTKLVGA